MWNSKRNRQGKKPIVQTDNYSGLRAAVDPDPKARAYKMAALKNQIRILKPLAEAMRNEPYYFDDIYRTNPDPIEAVANALPNSELFVSRYEDVIAAVVTIGAIWIDRHATFEGWTNPAFRQDFKGRKIAFTIAHEIIEYCFQPWPSGLGLVKLKADICAINKPSLRAARCLGFEPCGYSRLDALYYGVPYDIVRLELLNPRVFAPVVESLKNGQVDSISAQLRTSGSVHAASSVQPASELRERGELQQPELREWSERIIGSAPDLHVPATSGEVGELRQLSPSVAADWDDEPPEHD